MRPSGRAAQSAGAPWSIGLRGRRGPFRHGPAPGSCRGQPRPGQRHRRGRRSRGGELSPRHEDTTEPCPPPNGEAESAAPPRVDVKGVRHPAEGRRRSMFVRGSCRFPTAPVGDRARLEAGPSVFGGRVQPVADGTGHGNSQERAGTLRNRSARRQEGPRSRMGTVPRRSRMGVGWVQAEDHAAHGCLRAVEDAAGEPVPLRAEAASWTATFPILDGLILTGGNAVDPRSSATGPRQEATPGDT
jgi:hypothetical protein